MGLKASNSGGQQREPVEAGAWRAVCVGYVDLGTQHSEYQGKKKAGRKVMIFWDLPDQRMEYKGKDLPRRISAKYGLSLYQKASLRQMIDSWMGRPLTDKEEAEFDLDQLIGRPCFLNVIHETKQGGGVYAKVKSVMQLPKGMQGSALETEPLRYQTLADNGDFIMPSEDMPEWIRKIIYESDEYKQAIRDGSTFSMKDAAADAKADIAADASGDDNDPIPF
jgi:hypothetical protein